MKSMKLNSRQKGARGEREFAKELTKAGFKAWRGQQHKGTEDSPDVECPALSDYHFECKFVEALRLYPALEQAMEDAPNKIPVVAHRKKRQEWVAILPLSDFLDLLKQAGVGDQPSDQPPD